MAKTTAPLLSFGASGKLADTLVFGRWKGVDYARQYVVPANPQSSAQQTQRGYFTGAVSEWHTTGSAALEGEDKEAWGRYASTLGAMSGFNAFVRSWVKERVAGGTPPGHFYGVSNEDLDGDDFGVDVEGDGLSSESVTIHIGNSLTFFGVSDSVNASGGTASFSGIDTGFSAGERIYWYFEVGSEGTDYMRSGIYTAVLTE